MMKKGKKDLQLKHDSPDYQKISDRANKRHQGEEGGVQVIIWHIKDKYLPSKSSKLARTTWHSMHTMKYRVKWVMEFLFSFSKSSVVIKHKNLMIL